MVEIWWKNSGNMVEIQCKYGGIWPIYGRNMIKICGKNMDNLWQKYNKSTANLWPKYGRNIATIWPKYGGNIVEIQ